MKQSSDKLEFARTILGRDFISPEDIMKSCKGVVYTDEQLSQFHDTTPSQEVLEWCRDNGYILIAGPNRPMSLLEIRSLKNNYFPKSDHIYSQEDGCWYEDEGFARNDKVETGWIMVLKEPVPQSTSMKWNEQQGLLSETEVTPNVAEVAWCLTTYKAVRNTYLLPTVYVRTSSIDSNSYRVDIGYFTAKGLDLLNCSDDRNLENLGLSAARKVDP